MKTTLQILKAARALISEPSSWIQGTYARNADGRAISAADPKAVQFCSLGAIQRVMGPEICLHFDSYKEARDVLRASIPSPKVNVILWNDESGTSHEEVLKVFDKAIEKASCESSQQPS